MRHPQLARTGALAIALPAMITIGLATTAVGSGALTPASTTTCAAPAPSTSTAPDDPGLAIDQLSTAQRGNARIIYTVAAHRDLPHRAGIIALATALQESTLRNLTVAVDHDSLGLFQQRPSQGWGTPAQILDPVHASNAFYTALLRVPNWQTLRVTEAAQAVQRSDYPEAYAKWQPLATQLAARIAASLGRNPSETTCGTPSTTGWIKPVDAPVGSGFHTADRPGHDGVDLSTKRGTPIIAAAAGTVTVMQCNVTPASWGCNRDGGLNIGGCGWYVDIEHPGNVTTRYCHMLSRPAVSVGQKVTAGQPIGLLGSSGNSSGPHLHYEVHISGIPVNPVPFMQKMGAPL